MIPVEAFCGFSRNIVGILNNVPAEIQSEKLAKGKRNRGFSTIFEFFFFFFVSRKKEKEMRMTVRRRCEKYRYTNQRNDIFVRASCYILIVELSNP